MRSVVLCCLLLSACAFPHQPERDGVWVSVPRELVRCYRHGDQIVCRSYRALSVQEAGL